MNLRISRTEFIIQAPPLAFANTISGQSENTSLYSFIRTSLFQQLLEYIRTKRLLLVLDNFEHLLDGAGILTSILQAAPNVRIFVTSRERLKSRNGEVTHRLGCRFGDSTRPSEAVQLFAQRARSVVPGLQLNPDDLAYITRICRHMKGMPLGIELAATWIDVLSPHEIADEIEKSLDILEAEMRDMPGGQMSIRGVICPLVEFIAINAKDCFPTLISFSRWFYPTKRGSSDGRRIANAAALTQQVPAAL